MYDIVLEMKRLNQSRRRTVGYVQKPLAGCMSVKTSKGRMLQHSHSQLTDLQGDGLGDFIKGLFQKGKNVAKTAWENKEAIAEKASDLYTGEVGTAIRNIIPSSDDTARPGFPGEKHMLLKLPNGKTGVANYMGPGTEVVKRVRRGDMGRTPSDFVAKRHDIDYALAATMPTKKAQLAAVRRADNRMVRTLKSIAKGAHGGDAQRNVQAGMRLIQAKTIGEDLGLLDKSKFAGDLEKMSTADSALLKSTREGLEQKGFGLPGDMLRARLLKQMSRRSQMKSLGDRKKSSPIETNVKSVRFGAAPSGGSATFATSPSPYKTVNRNKGASYGKTLPSTSNFKMTGSGLSIPGGAMVSKKHLLNFVMKKVMPSIMTSTSIKPSMLNASKIVPHILKIVSGSKGGLPTLISKLSAKMLPILVQGKLRTLGMKKGMVGRGCGCVMKEMKGKGIQEKLAKGLFGAFKWFINRRAKDAGLSSPFGGRGLGLPGGSFASFWKGFKKGFTKVFKPGAKILGGIATALGQPEIGIPLGLASNLL